MSLAQAFLAEFEQELPVTRRFLERLPADKLGWRPHEKSMTAGQLAFHIASLLGHLSMAVERDNLDAPDLDGEEPHPANCKQIMDAMEHSAAELRRVLPTLTDERMQATWQLTSRGKTTFSMPRAAVVRRVLLNHWYHHRGQFGVYLRLLGASVPAAYGPSGDEQPV